MKRLIPQFLSLVLLLFCSCNAGKNYSYRTQPPNLYSKPVAKVEKVWRAQHKYDPERRLIIPMIGGSRWGAVQEYKEDGTLVYREWWERDAKKEDLKTDGEPVTSDLPNAETPSEEEAPDDTVVTESLGIETKEEREDDNFPVPNELILPPADLPDVTSPPNNELPPFAPLPIDSLPVETNGDLTPQKSPFGPLPPELPPL